MDRLVRHSVKRCIGPYLTREALTATALGMLCVGMTHGQVGVESTILTNNAATPGKSLKMAVSDPIQLTIGSPAFAKVSRDSVGKDPNCTGPMRSHSEITVSIDRSTMM